METKKGRCAVAKGVIITVLMITPAVLSLLFIKEYGVNVPFWDQWELVPLFDKLYTGHLSFTDLFAQHNEHRVPFAWLIMLVLGAITHYNNIVEMYFSWFLLCLISVVLLSVYIRNFGTSQGALAKFIPVVWLIFSLRQWEILLWGIGLSIFMSILFFLLAIYLLDKSRNIGWRFILSITSAIVCTFSFGNGLLIWPIGFIQILRTWWLQDKQSKRLYWQQMYIWCLMGILVYIAYFVGYTKPSHHPDLLYFLSNPFSAIKYLLVAIGSPLAFDITSAIGMGILVLALYIFIGVYLINKFKTQSYMLFPLALILYACFTIFVLVITRSGFGIEQALSPRYTSFTILGIVGLYLLLIQINFRHESVKPFLSGFMISLIALGLITANINAIECGKAVKSNRDSIKYILTTVEFQSDENLARLYPNPQVVRERAEILKKYKLNVFASPRFRTEKLTLAEGTTLFAVDTINGRQPAQQGSLFLVDAQQEETVTVSGWAVDQRAEEAAGGVFINIDGQRDIPAAYGHDRPDVAKHFQNSRYRFSGFLVSFATSALGEGQHILSLKIVTADKKGYYKPEQRIVLEVR